MKAKKLITLAVFTAIALIIHILESLVPLPVPVPGVKLGLANVVTLFMLFALPNVRFRPKTDTFIVLLCRIVLGAIFTGRPIVLVYSLAGGLSAFAAMSIAKHFLSDRQVWVCGAIGAIFHNTGQILAAVVITGTPAVAIYLPVLIITGIVTGSVTGLLAGLAISRLKTTTFIE